MKKLFMMTLLFVFVGCSSHTVVEKNTFSNSSVLTQSKNKIESR